MHRLELKLLGRKHMHEWRYLIAASIASAGAYARRPVHREIGECRVRKVALSGYLDVLQNCEMRLEKLKKLRIPQINIVKNRIYTMVFHEWLVRYKRWRRGYRRRGLFSLVDSLVHFELSAGSILNRLCCALLLFNK